MRSGSGANGTSAISFSQVMRAGSGNSITSVQRSVRRSTMAVTLVEIDLADLDGVGDDGHIQPDGHARPDLGRVAVDGLLAEEDQIDRIFLVDGLDHAR